MWISRKDFIVLPYLCSQEYMVERRAYHLSQKKTHQKIARFRSVSVKRKERPLIEGLGVQKHLSKAIAWLEKRTITELSYCGFCLSCTIIKELFLRN